MGDVVDRWDCLEPKEWIGYTRLQCRILESISKIPWGTPDLENKSGGSSIFENGN